MSDPKTQNEKARKYAQEHPIETVRYALDNVARLQVWTKKDPEEFPKAVELGNRLQGFELEGRRYVCEGDFDPPELVKKVAKDNMVPFLHGDDKSVVLLSGEWQQPSVEFEKDPNDAKSSRVCDRRGRVWVADEEPYSWIIEALDKAAVGNDGLTALAEVVPIDPDTCRPDPLFAASLVMVNPDHRQASLFSPPMWGKARKNGQIDLFPGFGPGQADGPHVPALPLALYDLGVGVHQLSPGSGAPLALRIFVEMCLSVPLKERNRSGPVLFKPQRFSDFLTALYPNPSFYRASRHYGPIREALESLTTPEARIPWVDSTGDGAARFVVVPLDVPRDGGKKDWIQFQVHLPPGSDHGAIMDRPALRVAGVKSVTMYRMALSLALWWHDPGRLRIPLSKGKCQTWRQVRSPERYPEVPDIELIAMAYPRENDSSSRMRLLRAREALDGLVKIGYATVNPGRRISPGPKWPGWGQVDTGNPAFSQSPETQSA